MSPANPGDPHDSVADGILGRRGSSLRPREPIGVDRPCRRKPGHSPGRSRRLVPGPVSLYPNYGQQTGCGRERGETDSKRRRENRPDRSSQWIGPVVRPFPRTSPLHKTSFAGAPPAPLLPAPRSLPPWPNAATLDPPARREPTLLRKRPIWPHRPVANAGTAREKYGVFRQPGRKVRELWIA